MEDLNPGSLRLAWTESTSARSERTKTAELNLDGFLTPRMSPCAIGLRKNATSRNPVIEMSPTKQPRPRIRRPSSFRSTLAPMPSLSESSVLICCLKTTSTELTRVVDPSEKIISIQTIRSCGSRSFETLPHTVKNVPGNFDLSPVPSWRVDD